MWNCLDIYYTIHHQHRDNSTTTIVKALPHTSITVLSPLGAFQFYVVQNHVFCDIRLSVVRFFLTISCTLWYKFYVNRKKHVCNLVSL